MPWVTAALLLLFGCIMALVSLLLPPKGEIDGSVLMLFAQILVYAGSIYGVKIYIHDLFNRTRDRPEKRKAQSNSQFT